MNKVIMENYSVNKSNPDQLTCLTTGQKLARVLVMIDSGRLTVSPETSRHLGHRDISLEGARNTVMYGLERIAGNIKVVLISLKHFSPFLFSMQKFALTLCGRKSSIIDNLLRNSQRGKMRWC